MFTVTHPDVPTPNNERLRPFIDKTGRARYGRKSKLDTWQKHLGLAAQAQLRRQGMQAPLAEPLLALYLWTVPRGRRDWDAGVKDTQDALNGVAWDDDRRLITAPGLVDRRTHVSRGTYVWIARATVPEEVEQWHAQLRQLVDRVGPPELP